MENVMGAVSLWHWIVVLIIIAMLSSIIISPIIWFITKNPNNKWLKILYWVRFSFGVIVIILIIKDLAVGVLPNSTSNGSAEELGEVFGILVSRSIMAWLLMRRWVKPKPPEDTPMQEQIASEAPLNDGNNSPTPKV